MGRSFGGYKKIKYEVRTFDIMDDTGITKFLDSLDIGVDGYGRPLIKFVSVGDKVLVYALNVIEGNCNTYTEVTK